MCLPLAADLGRGPNRQSSISPATRRRPPLSSGLPRLRGPAANHPATKNLLGHDFVLTIQISPYGRVLLRPEGPPNLYQLRGRWEWVTLLVELIKSSKNPPPASLHYKTRLVFSGECIA